MKLKDITNSKCDVRELMTINIDDETIDQLIKTHQIDIDVIEAIVKACAIYIPQKNSEKVITPFDIDHFLNQRS